MDKWINCCIPPWGYVTDKESDCGGINRGVFCALSWPLGPTYEENGVVSQGHLGIEVPVLGKGLIQCAPASLMNVFQKNKKNMEHNSDWHIELTYFLLLFASLNRYREALAVELPCLGIGKKPAEGAKNATVATAAPA